jgi:hypothetical protein
LRLVNTKLGYEPSWAARNKEERDEEEDCRNSGDAQQLYLPQINKAGVAVTSQVTFFGSR